MEIYKILTIGHPLLRKKIEGVEYDNLPIIAHDLIEASQILGGYGLAANQIGEESRVVSISLRDPENKEDDQSGFFIMVDPRIIDTTVETSVMQEYCFSIPGMGIPVERPVGATVDYEDLDGKTIRKNFEGVHAKAIQHEIDHLNGKLISDYLDIFGKNKLKRVIRESKKRGYFYPISRPE